MPRKIIKAAELFEAIEIDLWGTMFRLREPTRSLEEKSVEQQKQLDVALSKTEEEETSEEESRKTLLPLFFEALDMMLEPTSEDGGKKVHAKTIVKDLYDKDKIGLSHIQALVWEIGRASRREDEDGNRPT